MSRTRPKKEEIIHIVSTEIDIARLRKIHENSPLDHTELINETNIEVVRVKNELSRKLNEIQLSSPVTKKVFRPDTEEVLREIIFNSIDGDPLKPDIRPTKLMIQVKTAGSQLIYRFEDDGPGFSPTILDRQRIGSIDAKNIFPPEMKRFISEKENALGGRGKGLRNLVNRETKEIAISIFNAAYGIAVKHGRGGAVIEIRSEVVPPSPLHKLSIITSPKPPAAPSASPVSAGVERKLSFSD